MTQILETDPALSIPAPDPIGRLYRRPGSAALPVTATGNVILPSQKEIFAKIASGEYMPSITNVIDTRNKPFLQRWAAKLAAQAAVDVERQYPGRLLAAPDKAVEWLKNTHERNRDEAADQGTRVHRAAELLSLGEEVPDGLLTTARMKRYIDAWKAWADAYQPEFLSREVTVFGETPDGLPYAGTADFVARINGMVVAGDYKSTRSGLHDDVSLQLTAVTRAELRTDDDRNLEPNHVVDAAIAVHLDPKGFTVKQTRIDDEPWEVFSALRKVWTFHSFDGMFVDGKPALSAPLVGPQSIKSR